MAVSLSAASLVATSFGFSHAYAQGVLAGSLEALALRPSLPSVERTYGTRYWHSKGKSALNLYDDTGSTQVSRLTYDGISAHSGELFAKIQDANGTFFHGIFVKGYAGLSAIPDGNLNDEDFPPVVTPYSSTNSALNDGQLYYFGVDAGFLVHKSKRAEIGLFTGYHYMKENVHAFGCTQIGGAGSTICDPALSPSTAVISNEAAFNSWRLGATGTIRLTDRLSLTGEAAWVPITSLSDKDRHHLRPDINPVPIDGTGHGFQAEAFLDYSVTRNLSIGVGARYWQLSAEGHAHFEETPGGGIPQVTDFSTERYGVFVQGSLKLN